MPMYDFFLHIHLKECEHPSLHCPVFVWRLERINMLPVDPQCSWLHARS